MAASISSFQAGSRESNLGDGVSRAISLPLLSYDDIPERISSPLATIVILEGESVSKKGDLSKERENAREY